MMLWTNADGYATAAWLSRDGGYMIYDGMCVCGFINMEWIYVLRVRILDTAALN